ncbi:hypothetical protein OG2516_05868 [Oceanicola granulosus HTCC2516]|uniref:Lipoprotein n=1 Tax=Oceanicola granulosus (strain ATCC BAA-861 / DSM 15982 / KCTC 12143 / HTCC2516) TaxID=314256 RepID=Q2CIH8_OCEGH|nr:hypothetical protein [Oceanicola granulosus]EAR52611.1 hypothetical protein OG2516_05868 [Oceanicola granulosus HTCC2516]
MPSSIPARLFLASALLALAACGREPPLSNPPLAPLLPEPVAVIDLTPDPTYTPPADPADISCQTINGNFSTGPLLAAATYGLGRWQEYAADTATVQPPPADGLNEIAVAIRDTCELSGAGDARDAVNIFLSQLPGSVGQSFGGATPPGTGGLPVPAVAPLPERTGLFSRFN